MPPASDHPSLQLRVMPNPFFVLKMEPGQPFPPCLPHNLFHGTGRFFSITRTEDEVSIVGESIPGVPDRDQNSSWMCIKVAGPMESNLTGILTELTAPLKRAKVPVFALSTCNTDYILVPKGMIENAVHTLENDGWSFVQGIRKEARL